MVHEAVNQLGDSHYVTLKFLVLHLSRVEEACVAFAPALFGRRVEERWCVEVLECIVCRGAEIFDDDPI